jgi:hypothetical protein
MTKMITIQPKQRADGVLPYPFHIQAEDSDEATRGAVGRQDVWHGKPERLVGFVADPETQQIDLVLAEFLNDPEHARGMHPVMQDSKGGWATYAGAIERVETWTAGEGEETFVRELEGAGKEQ